MKQGKGKIRVGPWLWIMLLVMGLGCSRSAAKQGGPPRDAKTPVVTFVVRPEPFKEKLFAAATLAARERVVLKSEAEGRIVEIGFAEGDWVEAGQVLFRLDAEKLTAALQEAEAGFALAEANRARAEKLFKSNTISAQEYDTAVSAYNARKAAVTLLRKQLEDSVVRAPFSGFVGERLVSPGQIVARLTPLATLVDLETIRMEFRVPERFLARLSLKQTVEFETPAWPGVVFTGSVYFISPELDPATRTFAVKAEVPNTDHRLRPGMFGTVQFIVYEQPDALLVPDIAVIHRGDKTFVYTVNAEGRAELREVKLGGRVPGRARVLEGLEPGAEVITEGHQKIGPGAAVETS